MALHTSRLANAQGAGKEQQASSRAAVLVQYVFENACSVLNTTHQLQLFRFGMNLGTSSSLRFGDVICLGLELAAGSDDGMFYVLGHQSPLSSVEGCQDVIDHILVAEKPNTFQSPSDGAVAFPVPVHSREYWFEIVGKSEYMMQQMLQKLKMQLHRLEAEEEIMVQSNGQPEERRPSLSIRRPSAVASPGGGFMSPISALRRRSQDTRLDQDIELSEVHVSLLVQQESTSFAAESPSPVSETPVPKLAGSSDARRRLEKRIADLEDLANGEAQRNSENESSRKGSAVRYGDVVQLRHVLSKKFVALASGALSSYELSDGNMNCWFAFEPAFKLSAFGDVINLDSDGKLSVKLVSANTLTEGKVYMAISSSDHDNDHTAEDADHDEHSTSLSTNLALDGVLEPSRCIPIRTVSSGNSYNRISIFRAGTHELLARTFDVCGVLSGSTIVRFYYRESDSFLAGKRPETPDELNKPFLIPAADCTTAKIHDFALTLWFVVDGDGNLSGCGDKLGLGSMVALQHVVSGLILVAVQNPKYTRKAKRRNTRGMAIALDMEKSPTASPEVGEHAKKSWGKVRGAVQLSQAFASPRRRRSEPESVIPAEPFFNLVLLSLKSVCVAQEAHAHETQIITRWQITPPSNKLSGQEPGEISNKNIFLLTSCSCDQIVGLEYSDDDIPNVVIGVAHAAASDQERRPIGAVAEVPEDKLPEFLFNVDFISPKMLEFVEKPRAAVFILYTFFIELQAFESRAPIESGSPVHKKFCAFIDKFGQRVRFGFEIFARLCCSDSKDQISDVSLERLIFEVPNRKMQLLFGQLGAVSLVGSLIQTLQSLWKGQVASSGVTRNPPVYPADVAQVLEDATCTALIAFVCLCSGCPENKESVSPDMLELLSEKLLPIQILSDTVVRAMVALSAENQSVVIKSNKSGKSALEKIYRLLNDQRRSTFVDFLSSFLKVNSVPVSEYQRILLKTVFIPDAAAIADGKPQASFFPRVKFLPWKCNDTHRLSCHIMMDSIADWGFWPLKDQTTNLIEELSKMTTGSENKKLLPSIISLDPSTKSVDDIRKLDDKDRKKLVRSLCILRIQYLCSLYCLVASLCYSRNVVCRNFFLNVYKYSKKISLDGYATWGAPPHTASSCVIPDFNMLVLGVVEDKMPAAFKSACVQLLHVMYVSNDPWTEKDILPHVLVDKCFPQTDSREQAILIPAHTGLGCISFDKLTADLAGSSHVSLDHSSRSITFHTLPSTIDFPFNFAELNGHHFFEIQVSSKLESEVGFEIGFVSWDTDRASQPSPATRKLMWNSTGYIVGVMKCKHFIEVEPIERVAAPAIRHGDVVGCGISASNQYFFTLNQRVFFLYRDESMHTLNATHCSPVISALSTPLSIIVKDIEVASFNVSQSGGSITVLPPPQHSATSTTISKNLYPLSQQMALDRERINFLLKEVQIPLKENDILENLFRPGCEDAKLMMQSLCKLVESALSLQIDDSIDGYENIIQLMRSCVSIFEYLSLTFYRQDFPQVEDGEDGEKEQEIAERDGSDADDLVPEDDSPSSSSALSKSSPMDDSEWFVIFKKGSSTTVLLYACSLLNTLFDLFTKRRIEVFGNFIHNYSEAALSTNADDLLKQIAGERILEEAKNCMPDLDKFLHVACRCPDDVVKSVVLKLLFEHRSYESTFIRSLIPVIFVDTLPPANANKNSSSTTQNALATIARSMERVTKQIRLSESSVRSFLEDPSFEPVILEPITQLMFAVEDLMSLILPKKAYLDTLYTFLIKDMASPCELLFDATSLPQWSGAQGSTVDPTPKSARVMAEFLLISESARISLDSVLPIGHDVIDEDILHRVGTMFTASEADQAIFSMLDISLTPNGETRDKSKKKDFLIAVSIVESIFLRMADVLCAATKLSRDCQNLLSNHAPQLLALVSSDTPDAQRGCLRSGAAKVLASLLHENTSFLDSIHSDDVHKVARSAFSDPDHLVINAVHSMLHQRDYKSQKNQQYSLNQSLVFNVMTEAIGATNDEFSLLGQVAHPSGPLQKCFDRDSVKFDANRPTNRHPALMLHLDVVRSISACLRANNFTKASIAPIIPLHSAFAALSLLLSPTSSTSASVAGVEAAGPSTMAVEWASSCIIYHCEMIVHAHFSFVQPAAASERTDDIPFATQNGLLPVLAQFVSAAAQVIKPLSLDSAPLRAFDRISDSNGYVDALLTLFNQSPSHFMGALPFMSLVAGKIADHCLSNRANAAAIPSKFEDFLRVIKQTGAPEELSSKFSLLQSSVDVLLGWKTEGNAVFLSLSTATLLFLMHKFPTDLPSFTTGQVKLAFNEVTKSLLWIQRASVQILPAFLSLYASTYLPPLHEENRKFVVEMGQKLDLLDRSYSYSKLGSGDLGLGLRCVRSNILKRAVSLFHGDPKSGGQSWLSPKSQKNQRVSLNDDSQIFAIFENPEFLDKDLHIKSFMMAQDTFLPESALKKNRPQHARRGSVVITDFSAQNCWESCVRKLSTKNKLAVSDVSDCISDGRFDIAFSLAESGLPIRNVTEAQRLERLESEAIRQLIATRGEGCFVRARVWVISALKSWKLFTYSLSTWIFGLAKSIALFGYRLVARVADLLGIKGFLLLTSVEALLQGDPETNLERRRFLEMDLRYKRVLQNVNHSNDQEDPNRPIAVKFCDASPPALVHSLVKSISVMEHARAVVCLGDAEREAMIDQFFLQALDVLRLHLYTSPCMTKAEAKMRAQAFNLKIPIVNAASSSSWIFRLNLVQNCLALGTSDTSLTGTETAKTSGNSSSHQELLSALIHLSLSTSPNPETRVAAIDTLACLLCGCSRPVLDAFGCHPIVQSPANTFFLSLAEAFESFRCSASSRAMCIQKYSDTYVALASGSNAMASHNGDDIAVESTVSPKFLLLLKAEVQRRIYFDAPPQSKSNGIFSFVSEGITFIYRFVIGSGAEGEEEEFDTTEAPVFVRMLLKVIQLRRLRSLFQFLLSRFVRNNEGSAASRAMKEVAVVASKRIFSEGLDLFNACNSLTRNLLVSPASFQANVSFQEIFISQEQHADLSNNVDISNRILGIIVQSLDAMQSGSPNMLDSFAVVNCYVNLQKFCFGQNRKVVHALSHSSYLTVYNRTITVMLSVFSLLNQKTGEDAIVFLDGFHPIDILMNLILLLRNLCTSDTGNSTCPSVFAGISWSNLFKLSLKISQFYNLSTAEEASASGFSLSSIANVAVAIREVFSNLMPNSESSSDTRRQVVLAREVLAGVFALKETVAYHSSKESAVPATLAKLFSEHQLDTLPMFSGPSSQICRIEVVRRDGKAELMFFQKPEELDGIEVDAGELMPIRDSHGESLRSHLIEAERMRLSVLSKQAFGAEFFRKFDYVPLVIGTLINLMLILFLALKVNDGEYFDENVRHPEWKIPLQLNWDNFINAMTWQQCQENCNLQDNPFAKIVPNIFTNMRDGGGGDTFVGQQCADFDPVLNATEYAECFKFPYSDQQQYDAAVAIGITFVILAFMNILATASNLFSWIYYSSQFVVRETVLERWYSDCKENSTPMFFGELESQFANADGFKIIIRNWTFWWLIAKCAVAVLSLLVHPIICAFLTIDAFRIKQVDYIFSAFTVKGKEFVTLFLLISAIIYLNAVFGIVFYWDQMANWSLQCSSLFQCTVSFFIVGWTGSIGDLMDSPEDDVGYPKYSDFRGSPGSPLREGDGRLMFRLMWQLMFFIAVPTCLISVVTGIIIDSFTEIRQSINERREKLENSCFVCDISSDQWRKVSLEMSTRGERSDGLNFASHVTCEHNILDYFYIFFRVRCATSMAHFTDQEHDLRRRFNQLDFTVFPMDQALSLARAIVDENAPDANESPDSSNVQPRIFPRFVPHCMISRPAALPRRSCLRLLLPPLQSPSFAQASQLAALQLAIDQLTERLKEHKLLPPPAYNPPPLPHAYGTAFQLLARHFLLLSALYVACVAGCLRARQLISRFGSSAPAPLNAMP